MSYILEALKKSQRDRELGQVPDLASESFTTATSSSPVLRRWLTIGLVLLLLLVLAALYTKFAPLLQQPDPAQLPRAKQQPTAADSMAPPHLSASPTAESDEQQTTALTLPHTAEKPVAVGPTVAKPLQWAVPAAPTTEAPVQPQTQPVPTGKPTPTATQQRAAQAGETQKNRTEVEKIREEYNQLLATQQAPEQAPAANRPKTASAPAKTKLATAEKIYPEAHELPGNIASRLPPRNIMLQSYSEDPAQRFVIINSQKLNQGQSTVDGLQVVEIRADGLLFRFDGHEFFQPR